MEELKKNIHQKVEEIQEIQSEYEALVDKMKAAGPAKASQMAQEFSTLAESQQNLSTEIGEMIVEWVSQSGTLSLSHGDEESSTQSPEVANMKKPARRVYTPSDDEPRAKKLGTVRHHASSSNRDPDQQWTQKDSNRMIHAYSEVFPDIIEKLGEPEKDLGSMTPISNELRVLTQVVDGRESWRWLPTAAQKALVSYIVARGRRLQDQADRGTLSLINGQDKLDALFPRLTAFTKTEMREFIHGLARGHDPKRGSWLEDARYWLEEINRLLDRGGSEEQQFNPDIALNALDEFMETRQPNSGKIKEYVADMIESGMPVDDPRFLKRLDEHRNIFRGSKFKTLRDAFREQEKTEEEVETQSLMTHWPYLSETLGKRAFMTGGEPREDARRNIEDAFGFDSLDWCPSDQHRKMKSYAKRIIGENYDIAILLTSLMGHDTNVIRDACKRVGIPCVFVAQGYGPSRIAHSIEKNFAHAEAAVAG